MRGRRVISPAVYQAIVEGFRRYTESISRAAEFAGVSKNTARKAWMTGFPNLGYRAVKEVIEEDASITRALRQAAEERTQAAALLAQAERERDLIVESGEAEARSLRQRALQDARDRLEQADRQVAARVAELNQRARVDSADQAADEATLSKFSRKNAIAMHAVVASSLQGAKQLAARLAALCSGDVDPATGKPRHELSVKQAAELFRQFTVGVHNLNRATLVAIQIERLRVGDPTQIVDVRDGRPATLEEAERAIAEAQALLEVARRREIHLDGDEPGGAPN